MFEAEGYGQLLMQWPKVALSPSWHWLRTKNSLRKSVKTNISRHLQDQAFHL